MSEFSLSAAAAAPAADAAAPAKQAKEHKGPPAESTRSKPTTKAERRALQDKQRAEKGVTLEAGGKGGGGGGGGGTGSGGGSTASAGKAAGASGGATSAGGKSTKADESKGANTVQKKHPAPKTDAANQVALFGHLAQYSDASLSSSAASKDVHPAVLRVGLQMADGLISGTSARMVAMLRALQATIADYKCPPAKVQYSSQKKNPSSCLKHSFNPSFKYKPAVLYVRTLHIGRKQPFRLRFKRNHSPCLTWTGSRARARGADQAANLQRSKHASHVNNHLELPTSITQTALSSPFLT